MDIPNTVGGMSVSSKNSWDFHDNVKSLIYSTLKARAISSKRLVYKGVRGGGTESNGGGSFLTWSIKKFSLFQTRKFSKIKKKQWETFNFLNSVNEIMRFFWKYFKILSRFSRKFRERFWKFGKCAFVGASGAVPPEASEII